MNKISLYPQSHQKENSMQNVPKKYWVYLATFLFCTLTGFAFAHLKGVPVEALLPKARITALIMPGIFAFGLGILTAFLHKKSSRDWRQFGKTKIIGGSIAGVMIVIGGFCLYFYQHTRIMVIVMSSIALFVGFGLPYIIKKFFDDEEQYKLEEQEPPQLVIKSRLQDQLSESDTEEAGQLIVTRPQKTSWQPIRKPPPPNFNKSPTVSYSTTIPQPKVTPRKSRRKSE